MQGRVTVRAVTTLTLPLEYGRCVGYIECDAHSYPT